MLFDFCTVTILPHDFDIFNSLQNSEKCLKILVRCILPIIIVVISIVFIIVIIIVILIFIFLFFMIIINK